MRLFAIAARSCSSTPSWRFRSMISFSISAFSVSNSARKAAILAVSAFSCAPGRALSVRGPAGVPGQPLFLSPLESSRCAGKHTFRTEVNVNQLNAVFREDKLPESGWSEACRATSRPICRDCVLRCFRCGAAESRYPSTKIYRPLIARERFPLLSGW